MKGGRAIVIGILRAIGTARAGATGGIARKWSEIASIGVSTPMREIFSVIDAIISLTKKNAAAAIALVTWASIGLSCRCRGIAPIAVTVRRFCSEARGHTCSFYWAC